MKISELTEGRRFDSHEDELDHMNNNMDYDGELDADISDIEGREWNFHVNQAISEHQHGITFMVSSFYDEGAYWDIDLGKPQITGHKGYESSSRHSPGGYEDVQWERSGTSSDIEVHADTENAILKQYGPHVTKQLSAASNFDEQSVHTIFKPLLDKLNA